MNSRLVCGSYPGAMPWKIFDDTPPEELADRLAHEAGCEYYAIDGEWFGPFKLVSTVEYEAGKFSKNK